MSTWRALAAVAALTILSGGRAVAAGMQCGEPKAVLDGLKTEYGELPAFQGESPSAAVMVTVSPNGSWSMLITNQGRLCMIGSGDHWQPIASKPAKPSQESLTAPALLKNGQRLI